MIDNDSAAEPDWETPLQINLTPAYLIHALFGTASTAHTAWSSCIEDTLIITDLMSMDERTGNYCRLVEQEYMEDDKEDIVWHDWAVEVHIGKVTVTGHWQTQVGASPMEWDWCAREAEKSFSHACVLFGKRVRHGLGVEEPGPSNDPPKSQRH
jgi:hypothetical protein